MKETILIVFAFVFSISSLISYFSLEKETERLEKYQDEMVTEYLDINTRLNDRIETLSDRITFLKDMMEKEEEEIKCVPFTPVIGKFAYQQIDYSTDPEFRGNQGRVLKIDGVYFIEITIYSYKVEGDCVTHINELGPDWIERPEKESVPPKCHEGYKVMTCQNADGSRKYCVKKQDGIRVGKGLGAEWGSEQCW